MIVLSNSQVEIIPAGGTVTFDLTRLHTGCRQDGCGGAEYHRPGTGTVQLRPGIYEVAFNGNVTNPTAGTEVQMAIAIDGAPISETTMIQTVSTANSYENIAASTYVKVCCGVNASITVENSGTTPVTMDANAGLHIRRVA